MSTIAMAVSYTHLDVYKRQAQVLFVQCPAEDFLLRVDSGEDGAVARRCSLVHESADACSHAPGFFEIAVVDGLRDSAALVSLGVEFEIVGALR